MVRRTAALAAALSMLFSQACYADIHITAADTIYNKPEITEFINAESVEGLDIEAYLDDEQLTVTNVQKASEAMIKTNYLFLIDESSSVSALQMGRIREAVSKAADTLAENETMTLIAFGENIEVRADHLTDKQQIKAAAANLNTGQGGTVLFDAVKRAAEMSRTAVGERNVVFIVSDGADFAVARNTYEEVEKYVSDYGIIVYAIALGDMSNADIDKFGRLARSSDGEIAACKLDTIDDNTIALMDRVRNNYAVSMRSKNNVVNVNGEKLVVKIKNGAEETDIEEKIIPVNWIKDTTVPEIISVRAVSDTSLLVEFSEDVVGAADISNYAVLLDGKYELDINSASYDTDTNSVSLIFEGGLYQGEYSIGCKNITDNSMEQNLLEKVYLYQCEGKKYQNTVFLKGKNIGIIIAVPFVLLALLALGAFAVISSRRGLIVHENKLMFKDNLVVKEKIVAPETTNISLVMIKPDGSNKVLDMKMYKSLIVGRMEGCDLCVNDKFMSRQHFAIEENNGIYTVMDLNSTSGTYVNGVKLSSKIKLENGDVILAGNVKFVFKRN